MNTIESLTAELAAVRRDVAKLKSRATRHDVRFVVISAIHVELMRACLAGKNPEQCEAFIAAFQDSVRRTRDDIAAVSPTAAEEFDAILRQSFPSAVRDPELATDE